MYYFINTFYINSLIGYIYEFLLNLTKGKIINNLLLEPIKPIYGIGVIIVLLIKKYIFKTNLKRITKIIIFIVLTFIIITSFEYISGKLMHKFLNKTLWSYKHRYFHIGKYICLEVSILWTTLSTLYVFILEEKISKVIKKIPVWFTNILLIITITDILLSLII